MGESVREIRQINREIFIQSVLVMSDTSETQTNAAQETTEASETPVVVEPEGAAEPEKREEVGEAKDNDDSQAEETSSGEATKEKSETPAAAETDGVPEVEKKEEVAPAQNGETIEEKKEESSSEPEKGTTCLTNESNSTESDIEDANKKTAKTVAGILARVKEDTEMSDMEKIDTLCLLLSKFVEENGVLKNEVGIMLEQIKKHNAAKETLKAMNEAYKRQVDLVKEECELRLKEEQTKRQDNMGDYSATMEELSGLLETQS